MKQIKIHSVICKAMLVFTLLVSSVIGAPGDAIIRWAGQTADSLTTIPGNELGSPDNEFTTISDFHYVWVRNFASRLEYSNLSGLIGVSPTTLAQADVIAFEGNGGGAAAGGGWESSTWFFSDLKHSYSETFNEITARGTIGSGRRARFLTGSISQYDYTTFFCQKTPCVGIDSPVISWILINVPDDINVNSPIFSVWVSGAKLGTQGTPDPDAIGVINQVEVK